MIRYTVVKEYIHLYINEYEKEYPIAISALGDTTNWNIFKMEPYKPFTNVSRWTLHLATTKTVDKGFPLEFAELIKEKAPSNKIDWGSTFLALEVFDEYRALIKPLHSRQEGTLGRVGEGMEERVAKKREIIDGLIKKYEL